MIYLFLYYLEREVRENLSKANAHQAMANAYRARAKKRWFAEVDIMARLAQAGLSTWERK
jgi:hypothetical protein